MVRTPDGDTDFFDIIARVFQENILALYMFIVVKLVTVVEGDQKAPFSIATTPRCRRGRLSFPWIAPLYHWYIPYINEC